MKDPRAELAALSAAFRRHLAQSERDGRTLIRLEAAARAPVHATPASPPEVSPSAPPAPARGKKLPLVPIDPEPSDYPVRMERLRELASRVSSCRDCGLCETRIQTVFARGSGRTRIMFVGEAPGADEDRQGFPFVGRAGQLLDQIIDAAGFDRESVYVANILKCRPPGNRDPRPEETAACTGYLETQIELINPKIICALGRHAAQFLTGKPDAPMGQLRGKVHYYRDRIMVLPTYHPAALLRNPEWKRVVWEDMQILRREYLR